MPVDDKSKVIEKYRLIYEKKSNTYTEAISKILQMCASENKELKIENILNDVDYFTAKLTEHEASAIRNAIVSILLKKELDSYDNKENIDSIFNNCEKLLMYSRENQEKEESKENPIDDLLTQGNTVLLMPKK